MNDELNHSNQMVQGCKSINGIRLLDIHVQRDEKGLRITLQSEEKFWKQFRNEDGRTYIIGGQTCFRPKQERLNGVNGYFISENTHEFEQWPNLTLLLAKNIEQGALFDFGAIPISNKRIVEYIDQFKKQVKILYLTYLRPADIRVIFSSETVEKEFHD